MRLFWILLKSACETKPFSSAYPYQTSSINLFRAALMNALRYECKFEHINEGVALDSDFEVYCWFSLNVQAPLHMYALVTERYIFFPPLIAVVTCQWGSFEKIWLLWENGGWFASTNNSGPYSAGHQFKAAGMAIDMFCSIRCIQKPLFDSTLSMQAQLSHRGPVQSHTNHQLRD